MVTVRLYCAEIPDLLEMKEADYRLSEGFSGRFGLLWFIA